MGKRRTKTKLKKIEDEKSRHIYFVAIATVAAAQVVAEVVRLTAYHVSLEIKERCCIYQDSDSV
ncbi:unnamed protein product [Brassica oleracea var. botrytis]